MEVAQTYQCLQAALVFFKSTYKTIKFFCAPSGATKKHHYIKAFFATLLQKASKVDLCNTYSKNSLKMGKKLKNGWFIAYKSANKCSIIVAICTNKSVTMLLHCAEITHHWLCQPARQKGFWCIVLGSVLFNVCLF